MFERSKDLMHSVHGELRAPFGILLAWFAFSPAIRGGENVTVGWSPSPSIVVGYAVYYGTMRGVYSNRVDAGTNMTCTISNLEEGITYYFAATAYDDLF